MDGGTCFGSTHSRIDAVYSPGVDKVKVAPWLLGKSRRPCNDDLLCAGAQTCFPTKPHRDNEHLSGSFPGHSTQSTYTPTPTSRLRIIAQHGSAYTCPITH